MKKNTALLLLSLPLVAGLLVALGIYGRPFYHQRKVARFQQQAEQQFSARDFRSAWLSAQQTFRLSPTNLPALRILVDIAAQVQSPSELDLRRHLVELEPTLDHQLLLASAALRTQRPPFPAAAEVVEELAATASNSPAYHLVAAQLALQLQQPEAAAVHFQQAAALDPTNRIHQLNLSALRLGSSNATTAASARANLEALANDPSCGILALRWLVNDNFNRGQIPAAADLSGRLVSQRQATAADRLKHLDILWAEPGRAFTNYLGQLQQQAATNAVQVYQVSAWLLNHGLAGAALRWLQSLPEELRLEQPVPVALADALLSTRDAAGAERFLNGPLWGEAEYLRLAFLSDAARQLNQPIAAAARWREAVRSAGEQLGPLTDLSNLARDWKLADERTELLWLIVERFPRQRWALRDLDAYYQQNKDLRGLRRVYQRQLGYDPKDIFVRNNLAAADLLLNQGVPEAAEIAKALYHEQTNNPVIASTYAFALHKQGRTREGLAVLARLKPEYLQSPGIAVYQAVLLAAVEQQHAAQPYAAAARRGNLLPEELQLLLAVDGQGTNFPTPPK